MYIKIKVLGYFTVTKTQKKYDKQTRLFVLQNKTFLALTSNLNVAKSKYYKVAQ